MNFPLWGRKYRGKKVVPEASETSYGEPDENTGESVLFHGFDRVRSDREYVVESKSCEGQESTKIFDPFSFLNMTPYTMMRTEKFEDTLTVFIPKASKDEISKLFLNVCARGTPEEIERLIEIGAIGIWKEGSSPASFCSGSYRNPVEVLIAGRRDRIPVSIFERVHAICSSFLEVSGEVSNLKFLATELCRQDALKILGDRHGVSDSEARKLLEVFAERIQNDVLSGYRPVPPEYLRIGSVRVGWDKDKDGRNISYHEVPLNMTDSLKVREVLCIRYLLSCLTEPVPKRLSRLLLVSAVIGRRDGIVDILLENEDIRNSAIKFWLNPTEIVGYNTFLKVGLSTSVMFPAGVYGDTLFHLIVRHPGYRPDWRKLNNGLAYCSIWAERMIVALVRAGVDPDIRNEDGDTYTELSERLHPGTDRECLKKKDWQSEK